MVSALSAPVRFCAMSAEERATVLFDRGGAGIACHGTLLAGEARAAGRRIRVALTDRRAAGGSLGVAESAAVAALLRRCRDDGSPLVLVLDSAGARLDEGLPALGAFRRLYREVLDARLAGVPMIALLARDCFGGASMLAATCSARAACAATRYGMSGPGVIEALAGPQELDSADAAAVRSLYGARARAASKAVERVCGDSAVGFRQALSALLASTSPTAPDLPAQHHRLEQRLVRAGHAPVAASAAQALAAFATGAPVGALALWRLADCMLHLDPGATLTLLLDSPGQTPSRADEALVLSEYVAHAALCIAQRAGMGNDIRLEIGGEAAGGIYVALAAPARRVQARPQASVRVLPKAAVEKILRQSPQDSDLEQALTAGVIDSVVAA